MASRRLSISVSTRETKKEATDSIFERSLPAACACSSPLRKAFITARYRSRLKISVTLTLMPSASTAVMAGRPSRVAGILTSTLSRSTAAESCLACSTVFSVSWASRGSTSIETRPSTPPVASYTDAMTSQALRTSSVVRAKTVSSTFLPAAASFSSWSS